MVKRTSARFIARMIEGARPSEMRGIYPAPTRHAQAQGAGGRQVDSRNQIRWLPGPGRNGHDWTNRFHLIAESLDIPVERAIFDGEVVVIKDGRTNFSELQAALASG
jgi:hypothetical protein